MSKVEGPSLGRGRPLPPEGPRRGSTHRPLTPTHPPLAPKRHWHTPIHPLAPTNPATAQQRSTIPDGKDPKRTRQGPFQPTIQSVRASHPISQLSISTSKPIQSASISHRLADSPPTPSHRLTDAQPTIHQPSSGWLVSQRVLTQWVVWLRLLRVPKFSQRLGVRKPKTAPKPHVAAHRFMWSGGSGYGSWVAWPD